MRYLVAILFALAGAALAFAFVGGPVADWVVAQRTFESSDDAENLNQLAFMGVNLVGMILGWTIGWALGARLGEPDEPN
ncbi:MAG: hypothetical protein ACT4N2_15500 [Hyphomicrobium sp.]